MSALQVEQLPREKRRLQSGEVLQAFLRKSEEGLQLVAGERGLFATALHFDELAAASHDDVRIHFGVFVLDVVEVEEGLAFVDACADRGDGIGEGVFRDAACVEEFLDGEASGQIGPGDRSGARAAIGLEHIAVEPEGVLTEFLEVDDGAKGAPDQALNLDVAAIGFTFGNFAWFAIERRVGEHRIFRREPAAGNALLFHPRRDVGLNRRGANDAGEAEGNEHGTGGVGRDIGLKRNRAQLVRLAAVVAGGR